MLQIMKYHFRILLRNREQMFWILLFPILLGIMFKVAFSNISSSEIQKPVSIAVVEENNSDALKNIKTFLEKTELKDGVALFVPTYCTEEKAVSLLKDQTVDGILYTDDSASDTVTLSLTVSSSSSDTVRMNQSILQAFVKQYNSSVSAIAETAKNHPENLEALLQSLSEQVTYTKEVSLNKHNTDTYTQYFYNLMAMACLFTSLSGLYVSLNNQGNLSAIGARRNISPVHKMKVIIAELFSNVIFQFICNLVSFAFIVLVLKIDLTYHLPLAILTVFVGCLTGTTMGFFVGSIGAFSEGTKQGILVSGSLLLCFLSGLMVGNMWIIVENTCPVINRISPAALISRAFYTLGIQDNLNQYYQCILTLVGISALFCLGGFLLTRRKRYASI